MDDWVLSPHAERRLRQRGLTLGDVFAVLDEPEVVHTAKFDDRWVAYRGDLAVVYRDRVVITVMRLNERRRTA